MGMVIHCPKKMGTQYATQDGLSRYFWWVFHTVGCGFDFFCYYSKTWGRWTRSIRIFQWDGSLRWWDLTTWSLPFCSCMSMSRRRMLKGQLFDGFGTKCSMESSTWSRDGLVAQKDASLFSFTQLFRGAKLVNLTNSSVAMTIPLESLDAQLSLCEDALTPLEGNVGNKDRGRIGRDSWCQSGRTWIQNQHLSTSSISSFLDKLCLFFCWHFWMCFKRVPSIFILKHGVGHPERYHSCVWKPARSSESFECGRSWGVWQGKEMVPRTDA